MRWSWRRSSPPFTRKGWSRSSSPRMIRRLGRRMEVITFTCRVWFPQTDWATQRQHTDTQDASRLYRTQGKRTLSSKPVIFAWYSGKGLDRPSYCPATKGKHFCINQTQDKYLRNVRVRDFRSDFLSCWPGISSSLLNGSALNPLSQGEYSFRFPGSFWKSRIVAARLSTCRTKLLSVLFSNSLLPLGPSSFSTSLANFCYIREKNIIQLIYLGKI